MTTTLDTIELAKRFRASADTYREYASNARAGADPQHAAALEQVAVDYDAAAERLELEATTSAGSTKPARMTMGRVVEQLLENRGRGGAKTGAVTIGRSARGVVTWEIAATADPDELEQLDAALDAAIAAHDRLAELYPDTEGK